MIPLERLIHDLVVSIASEDITPLIDLMWGKENVSEFKLADKLEITVNQVRNMLYKLHSNNLVEFTRKKDKRKGWYIYYWTFNLRVALTLLVSMKKEKIALLKNKLSQKQVIDYFNCPKKCVVFKYDVAMEYEFKCPECGNILVKLDTKRQIFELKKRIKILQIELEDTKVYLRTEIERLEKKKVRAERRAAKKVKRKRKVKKKVKKKKFKKEKKKKPKKKFKKKKVKKKKVKKKSRRKKR